MHLQIWCGSGGIAVEIEGGREGCVRGKEGGGGGGGGGGSWGGVDVDVGVRFGEFRV